MDKVLIGKKSSSINQGYVFAPYILIESIPIDVGSNFNPKSLRSSRYGIIETKQQKRSRKIKSILENVTK